MGGSIDDRDGGLDSAGKRPALTIEGTATEISAKPETDDTKSEDSESVETKSEGPVAAVPKPGEPEPEDTSPNGPTPDGSESTEAGGAAAPRKKSLAATVLGALGSLFTHAVAGLLGGLAVLAAIAWGYLPSGLPDDEAGALGDRIGKLESAPKPSDSSAAVEALRSRVDALDSQAPDTAQQVKDLADRVAVLESSLNAMADAAEDGGSVADAAAIGQQVAEAEKRIDAKVRSEIARALAGGTNTGDAAAIEQLKAEIAGIDAKLKALAEAELGSGDAAQLMPEIVGLDERLGRIESTLPALVNAVEEEHAETKTATLAIAFANLREAVDAGRPYASELATLGALSPGAGDLGGLLDYEDNGLPTVRALTASFDKVRDEALAADSSSGANSVLNRLWGSAQSLVTIRRVDETAEGHSTDAVLARAGAQLRKGDLDAAVMEVEDLEGPPAAAFKEWLDAARARLDAESTLRRLRDILLVSLRGSDAEEDNGDTPRDETRQDEMRQDGTRQDGTRQDGTRQDKSTQ